MENKYSDRSSLRNIASGLERPVADDDIPKGEESQFGTRRRPSNLQNDEVHEEGDEYNKIIKSDNPKDGDDNEKEKEEAKHLSELFSHIDDFIEAVQSGDASTKTKQSTTTTNRFYKKEKASDSCLVLADSEIDVESSVSSNKKRIILNQPIDADAFGRTEPLRLEQHERLLANSPMTALSSSVGIVSRRENEDDKKVAATNTKESKVHRQRRRITFPQQLHAMLETAQNNGHDNIISWQKHGKAFMVKDKERFVTTILPNYFHQTQYRSFQRQLALYGFIRYTTPNSDDYGSYYHPNFVQGHPSLCHMIYRTAIKGTAAGVVKGSLSLSQPADPDFASNIDSEGYDDDAGNSNNNNNKIVDRVSLEQNTINPLNMIAMIPLDNPRNSSQHKKPEINKSTASIQENHQRNMVINDSTAHDFNMTNHDSYYYDNECDDDDDDDDDDIDNASMAEFLSDVDL